MKPWFLDKSVVDQLVRVKDSIEWRIKVLYDRIYYENFWKEHISN